MVKSTLKKYEKEIVNYDKEPAIVVTIVRQIFQCFGTKTRGFPEQDLGEGLLHKVYITHNHIMQEREYSFSNDDLEMFLKYDLQILRGCDAEYVYEFSRNPEEIDEQLLDWNKMESFQHCIMIRAAGKLGIGYRRWKI